MAWIVGAVAVATTAIQLYAQARQAEQQQGIARYNARVAENEATARQQQAQAEADTLRRRYDRVLGQQRALYGASGVQQEGTPLLVMMESEGEAALDVQRTKWGGIASSYGLTAEAKLRRAQVGQIGRNSQLAMSGTLLSGLSSAAASGAQSSYAQNLFGSSTGGGFSTSSGYQAYRAGERARY